MTYATCAQSNKNLVAFYQLHVLIEVNSRSDIQHWKWTKAYKWERKMFLFLRKPVVGFLKKSHLHVGVFLCMFRCDKLEGGWREVSSAPISVLSPLLRSRGQNQCLSWGYQSSSSSILIFHLHHFFFCQRGQHSFTWPKGPFRSTGSTHSPTNPWAAVSAPSLLHHHLPWHAACFCKGSIQ